MITSDHEFMDPQQLGSIPLHSTHAAVSHFFDFAEALAPSLNRYALTLKSPPDALDASWITKTALPLPAARSIATRRSTAARVMNPPLCVDR